MQFLDDSLLPENQEKLVIQVAPYGPQWIPGDSDDIPVTMDEQVQKAVDCYNAGATVLHVHVREADGKGSKRLSQFNELLARLREAVPKMVLQVGGSISFAPESEGQAAKWLNDDTRHMLAELDPRPDQVTVAINTSQMNVMELMTEADIAGTSLMNPALQAAYRDMISPSNPSWHVEHLKRLAAKGFFRSENTQLSVMSCPCAFSESSRTPKKSKNIDGSSARTRSVVLRPASGRAPLRSSVAPVR